MNDLPRQQLCKLIATYGRSLCHDPRRCEALLKDFCGQYRREVSVLVGALKEGVVADLLASQNSVPQAVLLARLTKRLHDNLALAEDAARWAVESWALALGVISSAECQPSPQSPPRGATEPTDPSWNPSHSPPPRVPPQYRQDNVFPAQSATPSPIVPTPGSRTQLSAPTQSSSFKYSIKTIEYAGLRLRFVAALFDEIILFFGIFIIVSIIYGSTLEDSQLFGVVMSFNFWIGWLYPTVMESSPKQATLGKMGCGIIVTDLNGERVSFGKATTRHFSKIISILTLCIGFAMAGFTEKKQALHDMIAGCLVVKK